MMDVKFLAKNKEVRKELIMPTVSEVMTTTTTLMTTMTTMVVVMVVVVVVVVVMMMMMMMMMMYEQTKFSHGGLRGGSRKGTDRGER